MQGARDATKIGAEESEVIFVRENVSMHPTKDSSQRISGRFRIIKRSSSLFMTWIPNPQNGNTKAPLETNSNASERDRNLYSIRPVPLAEVRSIWQHTRPFASQYIIVVLVCGLAHPPLFFPNGGIKQLINKLKEHVHIVRSPDDANLYLLNDDISHDPLQKSLTFLELRDVLAVTSGAMAQNRLSLVASAENENCKENSLVSMSKERTGYDPSKLNLREAQEKTAPDEMAPSRVGSFELVKSKPDSSLSIWGRARLFPLESEECATFLDNEGRVLDSKALRERIFYGGLEHRLRREVWKFLLGYHQYDSTYNEREELRIRKYKEYKVLKAQWQTISAEQAKRFAKFRERKSRVEKDVVRTDRFLPFYAGDDNQNVAMLHDILVTYSIYNFDLGYCQGMSDFLSPILFVMEDESESFWCFVALMEHLAPNFNRDQNGMHSQLLALSKLVELLDSPLHKYLKQADCLNYFFCFRWILIQFKREFEYENVMRLWEVLWTHYLTEHFHLYLCVALLKRYRRKIVDEQMDFDSLLRFINGLSGHIKLEAALRDAESLCRLAIDSGASCIPAGTPPSLPVPVL